MNIHEHQAKEILKKYGAVVPEGVFSFEVKELIEKAKFLKTDKYVLKAQIHAGGRGAGYFKNSFNEKGGVQIAKSKDEVVKKSKNKTNVSENIHKNSEENDSASKREILIRPDDWEDSLDHNSDPLDRDGDGFLEPADLDD